MKKNDSGFVCSNCGADVPKLWITSRNHCNKCLSSMHLDIEPGDRAAGCGGIMDPVEAVVSPKKGYIIKHRCRRCGAERNNKSAPDDSFERILELNRHMIKK